MATTIASRTSNMAVLKEYTCRKCGLEFCAFVPVCAKCGYASNDNRAFRTPPGINGGHATSGSARRIDRILENEFSAQGISNFSNRGGISRVEFNRLRQKAPGVYATPFPGAQVTPVSAQFVSGGLSNPKLGAQIPFQVDGQQWLPPSDSGGIMAKAGHRIAGSAPVVGGVSQNLANRTRIAGRTDSRGNQIP